VLLRYNNLIKKEKENMNQKKLNNKGFSLVELIVVIAIMAVLIGLLAPQFIKYVQRSRYSTDIKNGQEIATITQTLIADRVVSGSSVGAKEFKEGDTVFNAAVANNLASEVPMSKVEPNKGFFVQYNASTGSVKVYAQSADGGNEVYPKLGSNYAGYNK
jgi:hypothetical protein